VGGEDRSDAASRRCDLLVARRIASGEDAAGTTSDGDVAATLMPLFSTVIPSYNRAPLITATIESVLAQDFDDHEVIVVDDGSTDGTLDVLAQFGPRIRVLQQRNSGPAVARNRGIAEARGTYIATLDSDDLWFPWTLATYAQAAREFDSPAFIAGAPFVFQNEAQLREVARAPLRAERFADYLASGDAWRWFGASSFVLRADAVRTVGGFSTEWINSDDADLALRLGETAGFVDIQAPATFAYREHAGSLKSQTDVSFRSLAYMIAQENAGAYPGGRARRRERMAILTRHVRPFALECVRVGALAQGWDIYRRTFAWHLALGRVAFLCGWPLLALLRAARRQSAPR
jgi:glycosyltransferase involved in cell wall biosynthesis